MSAPDRNWSLAINFAEQMGHAVLVRNLDTETLSLPVVHRTVTIGTPEQAADVAQWVLAGRGGIFFDPNKLLDPAVIDKMIVLG